jgi:hypothetical protein
VHNHDPESSEDQSVVRRLPTTATLAYLEEVRVMRVMQSLQKLWPAPPRHFTFKFTQMRARLLCPCPSCS